MVDETRTSGSPGSRPDTLARAAGPGGTAAPESPESSDGMAEKATEKAGEMADQVKSMTGDAASRAKDAAESGRESTADALDRAASEIKERAGDGVAGAAAGRAAEGMEAAAGYLKEHETGEIWNDMEEYVRQHPMQAVAAAVAAGIVVGRVLR